MNSRFRIPVAASLVAALLLSGCSGGAIFKQTSLGDVKLLSLDARQRLVVDAHDKNGQRIVCAEPSPDAISAQAASLAASGSYQQINAGVAASLSESAASIAMRTQTIQLLRDGYYRICEARMNNQLRDVDYRWTLRFIDEFIVTVAAIEALGGIVQVPAVAIGAQSGAVVKTGEVDADGKPVTPGTIGDINVSQSGKDAANAQAIKEIVAKYYERKNEFLALMLVAENDPENLGAFVAQMIQKKG